MATPPNLVLAAGPQPTELQVSYSIAASAAAGTVIQGTISAFGPLVGAQQAVTVPITEVWHIVDVYVVGAPAGPDAQLITLINGYVQNMEPALSSLNLNLLTRFRLPMSLPLTPASTFASSISLLAANGTTAVTQVVKYKVVKAPFLVKAPTG